MAFSSLPARTRARGSSGDTYLADIEQNWRLIDLFRGGLETTYLNDPSAWWGGTIPDGAACTIGYSPAGAFAGRTVMELARYDTTLAAWEFWTPTDGMMLGSKTSLSSFHLYNYGAWNLVTVPNLGVQSVIDITATSSNLQLYNGRLLQRFTATSAKTLTIASSSSGYITDILNYGANDLTIVPDGTRTLRMISGRSGIVPQYGRVTLQCIATNEWLLSGDYT